MKSFLRVSSALFVVLATFAFASPVAAQYGEDPPESVVVGAGKANADGKFQARYTAPDEIAERYLIYVVGTDKDNEPFEFVLADVTTSFAGLSWSLNGFDMLPGSEYTIEARYHPGTDLGPQVLGITQLPTTGQDSRSLIGFGVVLVVIGSALFYGSRVRTADLK